ncbi:uncharacterized protein LOC128882812 isoform X2 [Hylaeus volcanicus]|uniref:uncharacterized protein LOC128882812 isoform X2 n=1 Tax=Hylaeus volcanicus TaxID=313075 RepID=UPI0023B8449C|nr:uncharacterized protein LOC128882812 isoform X2 [Hylaeus volcanicus]
MGCHKVCAIIGCKGSKKRMFHFLCLLKDKDRCRDLDRDLVPTCNLPAPAASVKPQEETGMEIEEEEDLNIDQPVLTVGCQDNVEFQDSVGLKDNVGLKGFIDSDAYNVLSWFIQRLCCPKGSTPSSLQEML